MTEGLFFQPAKTQNHVPALRPEDYAIADAEAAVPTPDYVPSSPEEAKRAEAMKLLGGGPIVRDKERKDRAVGRQIKHYIDGLHTRPVL